jgi:hypothetical protein
MSKRYRGYGYNKTGVITIQEVEIKTTTTTTTTTTRPPTKKPAIDQPEYYEYETESSGDGNEQTGERNINQTGAKDKGSSSTAYIVIVVIIIILVAAVIALFGLHYKRKLPQNFYNLGGLIKGDKQWKPVLGKDAEDDLSKHPTIVKNGGANGTANANSMEAQELGTIEDENTKINPELATVE